MAKAPVPGQTKTRLVPPLQPDAAAALYRCFLLDTIELIAAVPGVAPHIAVWPPDDAAAAAIAALAPGIPQIAQHGTALGERLDHVLGWCLTAGYERAAAINSDGPSLPLGHLTDLLDQLADPLVDVVLGPAEDGGYYLIGVKQPAGPLVRDVTMSTPQVLADTLAIAEHHRLRVHLGAPWYDVDEPADLTRLAAELREHPGTGPGRHTRSFLTGA
jgi:rSAM/selenodomain-associated transferase 1